MVKRLLLAVLIIPPLSSGGFCQSISLDTALNGLSKISFGVESKLVLGDTVDVLDPDTPKQRCIEPGEVKLDTDGAVESQLSFSFIKNTDVFEDTFKLNYSLKSNAFYSRS